MEKMMKKLMFALIAAVFCSSLMANVLIYDYAASFKRINVTGPVAVNKVKLDSPKVTSDKFTGYMVIAECWNCSASNKEGLNFRDPDRMEYSADNGTTGTNVVPGNYAVVYIKRNGGNFKYAGHTYQLKDSIYRAIGRFYVGMFGAKSGVHGDDHVNFNKFTDAEGFLSYRITAPGNVMGASSTAGFLGIGHSGVPSFNWWTAHLGPGEGNPAFARDYDTVDHAGFGKVYLKEHSTNEDCWTPGTSTVCWRVKNLSGSMLGGFTYTAVCSDFIFDVCSPYIRVNNAPISGTFTLKLNNGLSFPKTGAPATFTAAEAAILNKWGATTSDLYCDPFETTEFNNNAVETLFVAPAWVGAAKK